MIFVILACSALICWIIGLSLFQGIVIAVFMGCVWITGRRTKNEEY
jgi:MFS superfamily sulfate permease-like transporter